MQKGVEHRNKCKERWEYASALICKIQEGQPMRIPNERGRGRLINLLIQYKKGK
jgi:hypothetical protein